MKYCNATTTNHRVALSHSACLQDINNLIAEEGYSGINILFTNGEIVLNMDRAESITAAVDGRLEKKKSMDMAFGIKNSDSSKIQMLMVELRLNYKNPNNLNKK